MKRIFITGGASGLGEALALKYASQGWNVCIGDIDEARGRGVLSELQKNSKGQHYFLRCDVREEKDIQSAADWMTNNWGGADVVVNNAGVVVAGPFDSIPLENWSWILDINVMGVVRGCKVFTPIFKKQGRGTFINIASLAGLIYGPTLTPYHAAKAAVVAISESLRVELEKDGIQVSVVCPAFFRTRLVETARCTDAETEKKGRAFVEKARTSAAQVAECIYKGASRGDFMVISHIEAKIFWFLKRLLPTFLYLGLMKVASPDRRA